MLKVFVFARTALKNNKWAVLVAVTSIYVWWISAHYMALCRRDLCPVNTRQWPNTTSMLASVVDGGPTLIQHWVIALFDGFGHKKILLQMVQTGSVVALQHVAGFDQSWRENWSASYRVEILDLWRFRGSFRQIEVCLRYRWNSILLNVFICWFIRQKVGMISWFFIMHSVNLGPGLYYVSRGRSVLFY